MKSALFILIGSCIFFSSCSRSDFIYFSFYNISDNKVDISYSFNNNEYSLQLNPGINHTQDFKEKFNSVYTYCSIPNQDRGIIKDVIINNKTVVSIVSFPTSFNMDHKHYCYNFIIDDEAIYRFQFYPTTYHEVRSFFRNSPIETVNYAMIDFFKNNKNYKKYCGNYYWKNCMKLQKIGSRN